MRPLVGDMLVYRILLGRHVPLYVVSLRFRAKSPGLDNLIQSHCSLNVPKYFDRIELLPNGISLRHWGESHPNRRSSGETNTLSVMPSDLISVWQPDDRSDIRFCKPESELVVAFDILERTLFFFFGC